MLYRRADMEWLFTILPILGVASSVSAVIISLQETKRAKEAKKKLIEILGKDTECLQLIDKSKKVGDESELLELYETCIKRGLKELPASQRRYIQEGFYQPSEKGRKAYIETILSRLPHKQAA